MCERKKMKARMWEKRHEKKEKIHLHTCTHTHNNINKSNNAHQRLSNNTKSIVRGTMVWEISKRQTTNLL